MGIDIHARAERLRHGCYESASDRLFFNWRYYGMYGFLADAGRGEGVPPISGPRGLPRDSPLYEELGSFELINPTWLSVKELMDFNYDATFTGTFRMSEERSDGYFNYFADPTAATDMSFRRFLGPDFFGELERLNELGADRVVMFFF